MNYLLNPKHRFRFSALIFFLSMLLCISCSSNSGQKSPEGSAESGNIIGENIWSPAESVTYTNDSANTFSETTDNPSQGEALPSETAADSAKAETVRSESDNPPEKPPVIIVLDPGHGGVFDGAAYYNRIEKDMTLKVAGYIRTYLEGNYNGVEVFLTHETDVELSSELVRDLELRAIFAEEKKADALISLHFNASDGHTVNGATIYISRRENVNPQSELLADSILKNLLALGLKDNGVLTRKSNDMFDENGEAYDYYAINRHCSNRNLIGIIVEHCFMDNESDCSFLDTEDDLRALGEADAKGIAKYFGLTEKSH